VGPRAQCCQFVTDDALVDADAFDCGRCEFRALRDALTPENARAWAVWQRIGTRLGMEFGTAGYHLTRLTDGWPAKDVDDLMARLAVLYDTLHPARAD